MAETPPVADKPTQQGTDVPVLLRRAGAQNQIRVPVGPPSEPPKTEEAPDAA